MSDIIRLLPDSVANQIAAGEVIQRPASAVKELIENSLDSGATSIGLNIRDAGKTLIQVIDNGSGMTETDARMCFERHATSKITKAEDLFAIRTMGFRGEAMASIAAVAQVEMKTRRHEAQTGTSIIIEGSRLVSQEICATQPGTITSIKNLFFNIPARRNFLKSNAAETRHIVEEFQRVAIARPEIAFSMTHDGMEVFKLQPGNLRQRIMGIYGNSYNERLVPVQEETTILNLTGFVLKPEFARKTRGEQYFFVNNRFIRDPYLNHAVVSAFEDLLPQGSFPSYFLLIDLDPVKIDINIHPTKTEIKFDDEKSVYAIMRAAVKRSLGKFSVTPSLDFDQETSFNIPVSMYRTEPKAPVIKVNPDYNPFTSNQPPEKRNVRNWETLYEGHREESVVKQTQLVAPTLSIQVLGQLEKKYILIKYEGILKIIDQQAAHEVILYERNKNMLEKAPVVSQQDLFPQTMEFSSGDFILLTEISDDIRKLGFDIREFGKNTYVLNAVPSGANNGNERKLIESILESYKNNNLQYQNSHRENLLRSVAYNLSVKAGTELDIREMEKIAYALFECPNPQYSPSGKTTFITLQASDLEKRFQQKN